jgi:hypothetical protein
MRQADADRRSFVETSKSTRVDNTASEAFRTKTSNSPCQSHIPKLVSIEATGSVYMNYRVCQN